MLTRLIRDENGSTIIEISLGIRLFLVVFYSVIEFSLIMWQHNSAAKAAQAGARLAAVSNPVWPALETMTGTEDGVTQPGDPMPFFEAVCDGATMSCSDGSTANAAAFQTLVFGREGDTTCGTMGDGAYPGMCDVYDRITVENVIVEYRQSGLGFAGRPGGPVPTITVRLTGLRGNLFFLAGLLGWQTEFDLPDFQTTMTGEDLRVAAPS